MWCRIQLASVAARKEIRASSLVAAEVQAIPLDQICQCNERALLRCVRRGPYGDLHQNMNTFHVAERWEVSKFLGAAPNIIYSAVF